MPERAVRVSAPPVLKESTRKSVKSSGLGNQGAMESGMRSRICLRWLLVRGFFIVESQASWIDFLRAVSDGGFRLDWDARQRSADSSSGFDSGMDGRKDMI